jgi:hypothetical protein
MCQEIGKKSIRYTPIDDNKETDKTEGERKERKQRENK